MGHHTSLNLAGLVEALLGLPKRKCPELQVLRKQSLSERVNLEFIRLCQSCYATVNNAWARGNAQKVQSRMSHLQEEGRDGNELRRGHLFLPAMLLCVCERNTVINLCFLFSATWS